MDNNITPRVTTLGAFGRSILSFLLYFGLQIVISIPVTIVAILILLDFEALGSASSREEAMEIFMGIFDDRMLSIVSMITVIIAALILFLIFYGFARHRGERIFTRPTARLTSFYFFLGTAVNLLLSIVLEFVMRLMPPEVVENYDTHIQALLSDGFLLTLLSVAICAPFVEELIFRYGSYHWFELANKPRLGMIISALLFSIAHLQLIQSFYSFFLGILLAFVYYKHKNLLYPIMIHFGINLSSVMMNYVVRTNIFNGYFDLVICCGFALAIYLGVLFATRNRYNETRLSE